MLDLLRLRCKVKAGLIIRAYENHWFPLMLGGLLNLYFWGGRGGYLRGSVG